MKPEKYHFDVVVIGAGIIGIAVSLAHAKKGLQVLLVEKNPTFGQGISSRNSEVIHAGIYYPPNSLKGLLSLTIQGFPLSIICKYFAPILSALLSCKNLLFSMLV